MLWQHGLTLYRWNDTVPAVDWKDDGDQRGNAGIKSGRTERMKIGLALSGGGALGVAHIGVLEELERHHLRIDLLSGTSAGAIIGLLYADGGLPAIEAFLEELTERGISK